MVAIVDTVVVVVVAVVAAVVVVYETQADGCALTDLAIS